jgi:hypothetical protein
LKAKQGLLQLPHILLSQLTGIEKAQIKFGKEFLAITSTEGMFEEAVYINDKLSRFLGAKKGFFDYFLPVNKSQLSASLSNDEPSIHLSSLDILAYSYLKAMLENTPDSLEVQNLRANYKNLVDFVSRMDSQIERLERSELADSS